MPRRPYNPETDNNPISFREFVEHYLYNCAMFPNDIEQIVEAMIADPANEPMRDRWNDATAGYPGMMKNLARMSANTAAAAWIRANRPAHFALPIFDPKVTAKEQADKARAMSTNIAGDPQP